ncbi:RES domain-containing protein [Streptomyces sp. SID8350]|nr:RES domain-containing protein [Streptomyces sp. SID8350]
MPPPNLDARRFPVRTVPAGSQLYRVHPSNLGCWHFPCISDNRQPGARFDTYGPQRGTCYTATDPLTALAEVLGYIILRGPDIAPTRWTAFPSPVSPLPAPIGSPT